MKKNIAATAEERNTTMSANSFFKSKNLQKGAAEVEKQRTMREAWQNALDTNCGECVKKDICTLKNALHKQPFVLREYAALEIIALNKMRIRVMCEHFNRDSIGAYGYFSRLRYHSSLPCEMCNFSAFCTIKTLKSDVDEQVELIRNIDDCLKVDVACCCYEERKDGADA